jgi:hypothetical protein
MRSAVISWNWARGRGGDEGQVDLGGLHLGKLDFGLLGCFLQTLGGHLVGRKIDAVRSLELANEPVDNTLIPIVATEVGVAVGRLDFEDAVANFEHRHVECAAAQVEHQDGLIVGTLVETVRERSRGRLVDNA